MEVETGQRPVTEHLWEFHVFCTALPFNLSIRHWTHRFDGVGVYKISSSAPAVGMSYTVKLGCQACLGFVSKS